MFATLYTRMMQWARHRHAPYYLFGLAFAESSFFPLPPDVMLAPMAMAHPNKAWRYATLTTLGSVLGGMFGYLIGHLAFDAIHPLIVQYGYLPAYEKANAWFAEWGFWAVFLAGFSPIPYKVFTIAAGVISMSFFPFVIASIIGRGGRFYLVAGMMKWGGARAEAILRRYIDRIGWITVGLAVIIYLVVNGR